MIEISSFMKSFLKKLNETFEKRLWFVGLQGSYARGEATETSDIDLVVILDELSTSDINTYNKMLDTLPHRNLICGFISGKKEIFNWEKSDLFQFYYDTKPIIGSLDELISKLDEIAINNAIKTGVCNIYHGCVHNMLFDKNDEVLKGLYKSASFVIQTIVFKQTGKYISDKKEILKIAEYDESLIIKKFIKFKNGENIDFETFSEELFNWSKKQINKY